MVLTKLTCGFTSLRVPRVVLVFLRIGMMTRDHGAAHPFSFRLRVKEPKSLQKPHSSVFVQKDSWAFAWVYLYDQGKYRVVQKHTKSAVRCAIYHWSQ